MGFPIGLGNWNASSSSTVLSTNSLFFPVCWNLKINDASERFKIKFDDVVWLTTFFFLRLCSCTVCWFYVSTLECCVVNHFSAQHSHASGMTQDNIFLFFTIYQLMYMFVTSGSRWTQFLKIWNKSCSTWQVLPISLEDVKKTDTPPHHPIPDSEKECRKTPQKEL